MKQAQLLEQMMAGGIFCVGTFLNGRAEKINIRDTKTGGRRDAVVFRETIITENDPVLVSRWARDDEKAEDYKVTLKKGERCVVRVTGMEMAQGLMVLHGQLEALV